MHEDSIRNCQPEERYRLNQAVETAYLHKSPVVSETFSDGISRGICRVMDAIEQRSSVEQLVVAVENPAFLAADEDVRFFKEIFRVEGAFTCWDTDCFLALSKEYVGLLFPTFLCAYELCAEVTIYQASSGLLVIQSHDKVTDIWD